MKEHAATRVEAIYLV